jgi:hypothetical protein
MAIGKITGQMLNSNLDRSGDPLAIDGNLTYFDVIRRRVGINTTAPAYTLDVNGNAHIGNLYIQGNAITTDAGRKLDLGAVDNIKVTGGSPGFVIFTDGNGNLTFGNVSTSINAGVFTGADIVLGTNTQGVLVSSAVSLTTGTSVTDGVALLNQVLGKLVPPAPPSFPGGQTISLATATVTARMANFIQTDNAGGGRSVSGGTSVAATRTSSYLTTAVTSVGPGDSGTVSAVKNGSIAGSRAMTAGVDNGTYSDLIIAADQDYNNVLATVPAGFYQSFNAYASGTVSGGWNEVYLSDSANSSSTNAATWYYDDSTPGNPLWTIPSIGLTSNTVIYSSTIPHFTSATTFTVRGNIARLSGDMYHTSDTFITGTAGGAFAAPSSVTYAQAGVSTPLIRNLYVTSGSANVQTLTSVISGFGSSTTGPTLTAYNSYGLTAQVFNPGVTVLYKTGTGNQIEETALTIGSVGVGSGSPARIVNPGSTDTPAYTGGEALFNSQTGPFFAHDATVVARVLGHDVNNYSSGYLPVGRNLFAQSANQYFTFRFARTGVSKFNVLYTGTIAGLWVALPGSTINTTAAPTNGWLNMGVAYAGSGIPGTGAGGNGSSGCAVGGVAVFNSAQTNKSVTASFGTVSSSSTLNNYIYVRVKFTAGQQVTALQIQAASN